MSLARGLAVCMAMGALAAGQAGCGRTPGWSVLPDGAGASPDASPVPTGTTWIKFLELGQKDNVHTVAADCAGNSFIGGRFKGETLTLDGLTLKTRGGYDLFVASLDPKGKIRWAVSAGGPASEWVDDVMAGSNGAVYVAGKIMAGTQLGGIKLPKIEGEHTRFVAKLDAQGKWLWATPYGGGAKTEFMNTTGLALGPGGEVLVTGYYSGTPKVGGTTLPTRNGPFYGYIVRLNAAGAISWAKAISTTEEVRTMDVGADPAGSVYVSGYFSGRATFGSTVLASSKDPKKLKTADAFLTKLNAKGAFLWARQAGGDHDDAGVALAVDAAGNVYLGGDFMQKATFGSQTRTARGAAGTLERDIFVARYSPSGDLVWVTQLGRSGQDSMVDLARDRAGSFVFLANAELGGGEIKEVSALFGMIDASGSPRWTSWTGRAGGPWVPGSARGRALSLDNCTGHIYATGVLGHTAYFWPQDVTATSRSDRTGSWIFKLDQAWPCRTRPPCHTASYAGGKCVSTVLKDGTGCTDSARGGICVAGRCCTGCLGDGPWPLCFAGDGVSQCGKGGARCNKCGGRCAEFCSDGACKVSTAPNGAWCTGGTVNSAYGKCQGGKCCDGCLAAGVCYDGTADTRCGFNGAACQTCGPGTGCSKNYGCWQK